MSNPISRWLNSDVGYSFKQSKTAMAAALIAFIFIFCAVFAK
jgi:peptide/nickel transport system permease protein